ncbi:MAG TPA: hypothetical protein VE777_15670 [Gaiellales bacterium]|nr:hypothetical protein [Gaiellales bacterium]
MGHLRLGTAFMAGAAGLLVATSAPATADGHKPLLPNLVRKGSFEHPRVPLNMSAPFASIPGWKLAFGDAIEINAGDAAKKRQYVELDSDRSSGIYQQVPTADHPLYRLEFYFSPRPGTSRAENVLVVKWHRRAVAVVSADGRKLRRPKWKLYTFKVHATGKTTRLEFDDAGISDSVGTWIDGVRVTQWRGAKPPKH